MRTTIHIVSCIILGACKPSEAEVLERHYIEMTNGAEILKSCAEEQKIAAAWAREGDQEKYDTAKLSADMQCSLESAMRR